jgi:hypothetical protein
VENRQFASKTKGSGTKRAKQREQTHAQLGKFFSTAIQVLPRQFQWMGQKARRRADRSAHLLLCPAKSARVVSQYF